MVTILKNRFFNQFIFVLLLVTGNTAIHAQVFPIYDNQRISRPTGLPRFEADDFKISLDRIGRYPDGNLFGSRESLQKLGEFLLSDPSGMKIWKEEAGIAAKVLNQWDFIRTGFGAERYVKCVSQLRELALVYLYTGHRELGMFIRAHVLQIAELPFDFWVHAELRGYNPEKPMGGLETASLCLTISSSLSSAPDLYSSSEKSAIETALRTKGLQPCLNWLEKPRANNWTAVVSNGAYAAAKYFKDEAAKAIALKEMANYLNSTLEPDGSYGEGMGYFHYPIGVLLPALLMMNPDERMKTFSDTGLRNSTVWKVYPYLYANNPDGTTSSTLIHFSDNSYSGPENETVDLMLALLYQDPLASWLMNKFGITYNLMDKLLLNSFPGGIPAPKSPEQMKLPLVKAFSSGDCFIRSTWGDNGIVLGMRSGDGSRIKFAHQRPELGSICMGAYGEYLVVSPGSASYRSPLHYQWDKATRSANTITIDDKNQLFPESGKSSWNTTDVSGFWREGQPKAEVVQCKAGTLVDLVVNEVAQAYHVPMKNARRSVLFVRDPGYFVIIDKLESAGSQHKYTWRLHLNNRDEKGKITAMNQNHWNFSRPLANLDIYLFSDKKLETNIGKGYMHGTGRDYSPGGIYEGKPGSSVELEAFNPEKSGSMIYYSVLYPTQKGTSSPAVQFAGGKVRIGNDILAFSNGECTIEKGGLTEKVLLW